MTLFLALLLALVVSALVLALLLRLAPRTGLMDHPGERRRIHRQAVPRVGGLAIFAGLLVSLVVAPPLTAAERYGLAGAALLVLVTAHGAVAGLAPITAPGVLEGLAPITAPGVLEALAPVTALWLVAIPLMDTLAVMGRRLSQGRHPFHADRGHLHHRRALIVLLALALLLAGIGLAGQALAVPEALMFALALAVFGGYLRLGHRWPAWHRWVACG